MKAFLKFLACALCLGWVQCQAQTITGQDENLFQQYFCQGVTFRLDFAQVSRLYRNLQRYENRRLIREFGGKNAYKYVDLHESFDIHSDTLYIFLCEEAEREPYYHRLAKLPSPKNKDKEAALLVEHIRDFQQEATILPTFYQLINTQFKGDVEAYVKDLYENSIFSSFYNYGRFIRYSKSCKQIREDPLVLFTISLLQYQAKEKHNITLDD